MIHFLISAGRGARRHADCYRGLQREGHAGHLRQRRRPREPVALAVLPGRHVESQLKAGWKDMASLFFFFPFFFSFSSFQQCPKALLVARGKFLLSEVPCRRPKSRYSKSVFTLFFAFLAFLGRFLPPAAKKNI